MRTIVHLSDLHFGRTDPAILQPLIDHVRAIGPDVVVVSGDLTQRARRHEFQEAKKFLDALPQPQIVVPGNHDVPLYDIFSRFGQPLAKYRRYISADVEPTYVDDEIAVIGVNTARSLTFKGGRINAEQIAGIRKTLCTIDDRVIKIIVTHHPFDLPASFGKGQLVGRAKLAMETLADCGADLLLAGHLHTSHAGNTDTRYPIQDYAALVVQAGTATSVRGRGETNSFNVIRIALSVMTIERHGWIAESRSFSVVKAEHFEATRSATAGKKLRWLNVAGAA
jgi:3',5'-cyclic AMP phosphodiesterase CpdA